MKLPCPIHAVVGFDGINITVVAKSCANPTVPFSVTWSARDEDKQIQSEVAFFGWFRMRLPIEETNDPMLATLIVCDTSLFLKTTRWTAYTRDRVAMLDSRSMMFVLASLVNIGADSQRIWGEAVFQTSDREVLLEKLDGQIRGTNSLVGICGSVRETLSAAGDIRAVMRSGLDQATVR